jgi:membrane associated rhomboid family serine protease
MIIPNPSDLKDYQKIPLTITLVFLNIFMFILIFSGPESSISGNSVLQEDRLILSGRLYLQYLKTLPTDVLKKKPDWVHNMNPENAEHMGVLGAYSVRDADFLAVVGLTSFWGDEVQISNWKKEIHQFGIQYRKQLMFRFGLSSLEKKPLSWLTYQFSHSNWIHLLSNMLFLLLIGAAVEVLAGSAVLIFTYIVGGMAGGLGFLLLDSAGTVPMVGASASISALLAFYCVAELRRRIRYFYFISPLADHRGHIYLPTLMIVPLFLVIDIANLWSSPQGLGGSVAYAAHLGGTVFGLMFGILYRGVISQNPVPFQKS